ncbi:MAG: AmmeMemoRadiSam system protein B, partial [Deltaproteobacteria bacterium]
IVSLYQAARPYSPEDLPGEPFAFIVPHAGYRFSGRTAATVFQVLKGRKISRVILLAFPHRHRLDRLALPPFEAWETPIGRIEVDREAAEALRRSDLVTEMPQIDRDEHSAEIEIPLLTAVVGGETRLLPLYVGDLSDEMLLRCARLLRPYLDEGSVIVASSDFTHYGKRYGFVPFPPDERVEARLRALDLGAVAAIQSLDPGRFLGYLQETGATVCGRNPIRLLLAILALDRDRVAIEPRLLDYETSGHLTGDWTFSVGYVGMLFGRRKGRILDRPLEEKEREILLDLARRSLESVVRKGYPLILDARGGTRWEIPLRLHKVQGAFVTLWKGEQLRGCMGNVVPVSPLYQAVIDMAATAARKDPRFPPVRPEELGEIHIEVSVLSPFEAIETPSLIEIGKHGVLLRKGKY